MKYIYTMLLCCLCASVLAQDKKQKNETSASATVLSKEQKKEVKDGEMKKYFLVLLKRGPNRSQDSASAAALQKAHLDNITRLYNEGKMDIAGPMGHDGDIRGIFIFNCETYEEVYAHCSTDPMIKAGRLVMEIYPWWAAKGAVLR